MVFELYYKYYLILQPLLVSICFCFAWGIVGLLVWNTVSAISYSIRTSKQMHKIPCSHCQYYTNDYLLKCTIRPDIAMSEVAINCGDYAPLFS